MEQNEFIEKYEEDLKTIKEERNTNKEQIESFLTILEEQAGKIKLLEESVETLKEDNEEPEVVEAPEVVETPEVVKTPEAEEPAVEEPAVEEPAVEEPKTENIDDDIKKKEEELAALKKKKEEADNDEDDVKDKPPEEPEKPKVEKASFRGYEMNDTKEMSFRDSLKEYFKK